jgi:glycosyltransferase involved in cell wall biosynthesis
MNLDNGTERNINVSVCVVTYNHKMYLRECLDSLVSQAVDFDYEIIVGDDASTDGTTDIVREYAERYPELIIPIYHKKNVGPIGNYFSVHKQARGKYVCHMDGDDMALPKKLQIQSDYLDEHNQVSICWHRMNMFDAKGIEQDHPAKEAVFLGSYITRKDLLLYGPFGPHSSTMYRKENFSTKYEHFEAIDWIFSVELIGTGYGVMLEDVLGRYRLHSAGMSVGALASKKNREWLCNCQLKLLGEYPQYSSTIALRALVLCSLDFLGRRDFYKSSLAVFLRCKSFPDVRLLPKLIGFYKSSKLPKIFI